MKDCEYLAEAIGLARAWRRALEGLGEPLAGEKLSDLTGRLALAACSALHGRQEARAAGVQIGRSLAEANLTAPRMVENVVTVAGEYWLVDGPDRRSAADPVCVAALQGGIVGGHAETVRRLMLAQQEAIHRAAFEARKEAERTAHAAHARFEAIFASADVGIGVADLNGRILAVNQALQAMLGYSLEELRGRPVDEFFHPDHAPTAAAEHAALSTGQIEAIHTRRQFRHRDGREVSASLSVRLVRDGSGHPLHELAVLTDLPVPAARISPRGHHGG